MATQTSGQKTKDLILETAANMATVVGLEGVSIGRLATELGMSKSGVYAHFRSKEQLQLATIDRALEIFDREVINPALTKPTALEQFIDICANYFSYLERRVFPGGCFFVTVAAEFDARPGAVRERVAETQRDWMRFLEQLAQAAQDDGSIDASVDPAQLAFEVNAFLEIADLLYLLIEDEQVIERTRIAIDSAFERARAVN